MNVLNSVLYDKPIKVINNCETLEQLNVTEKYIDLFKIKYFLQNDFCSILDKHLFLKKMKLNNGW